MLNKTENNTNISSINPCSTESLIAVTGNDGETHIIQRELDWPLYFHTLFIT